MNLCNLWDFFMSHGLHRFTQIFLNYVSSSPCFIPPFSIVKLFW